MSRIGKKPIKIPSGVTVEVKGNEVKVKGPKGELNRPFPSEVQIELDGAGVAVRVTDEEDIQQRALWGTFASHVKNMIIGVSQGYKKQLEINGVGYRAALQGKDLKLEVGYSHPVVYSVPEGIKVAVEKNLITVEGANKELVGQAAAEIRAVRKPEPYKGKGIKYTDEIIRRKAGKAAVKATA